MSGGSATPADWTLTAAKDGDQPKISGRSGTPEVTAQRVPTGTWALTEAGSGAGAAGYVRDPSWVCRLRTRPQLGLRNTGGTLPVTGDSVVLPDSAQGDAAANVTCTVNNTFATGSLRISKVVIDPNSGFTGGTAKTFAGSYSCGAGSSGTFNTLTTASPVTISGLPAGASWTVTENPPTGGLANASFAWGAASISGLPAVIVRNQVASVTITNPVVQNKGSFAVSKVVDGPGGYVGGSARVFPVAYSCTLAGGPTSAGTLDVTTAAAVSPAGPIPTGSVCTFTETLIEQDGDFAGNDPSYSWTGSAVTPTSITIGIDTVAAVTVTNTYTRSFGSLTVAKTVSGDGYLGGSDPHFTVNYTCGAGISGRLTVADGGSATKNGLPAGATCAVSEVPPAADLLDAAHAWGPPSWSPAAFATIMAGSNTTLTVTNPTVPIFGRVSVTKVIAGASAGLLAGSTFSVGIDCGAAYSATVDLAPTELASNPDLPVGTSCTVTEEPPNDDLLLDGSYGRGPTPDPQTVTVTAAGQVVPVTVTNTIVRNRGTLTVSKALVDPDGVVDGDRTFTIRYFCVYGGDDPVAGSVDLAPGEDATVQDVLLGSLCTVTEDPASLLPPPNADDPSYVWLAETYDPDAPVVLTTDSPDPRVTVTNTVSRLLSSFGVSKTVTGTGKVDGYTGTPFDFDWTCSWPNGSESGSFTLADGESFPTAGNTAPTVPGGAECTVTEGDFPPAGPDFTWSGPTFLITWVPEADRTQDRHPARRCCRGPRSPTR